jgi:hypothetical protein
VIAKKGKGEENLVHYEAPIILLAFGFLLLLLRARAKKSEKLFVRAASSRLIHPTSPSLQSVLEPSIVTGLRAF